MHRNAGGGLPVGKAMMSMSVQYHVRPMTIDHLGQARTAEIGIDFRGLAPRRVRNRSIMQHNYALQSSQLRHGAFQLQGFIDRGLNEGLDFNLAECSQRSP